MPGHKANKESLNINEVDAVSVDDEQQGKD